MKSNFLILTLFTCLLMSCGNGVKSTSKPMKSIPKIPEIIGGTATKQIVSTDGLDTVECRLTYSFYSHPEFPWQDSVNYTIGKFVWNSIEFNEKPYVYQPLSHAFFQERLDTFARNHRISESESEYPMLWEHEGESLISDSLKDFVQVKQSCYTFTGGAHPNSFSVFSVISKKDGKTMQLKDLVGDVDQFNAVAEKYFREAREIGPEVSLSEEFWFENNVFACNNNFEITPEGIVFTFNSYEVAAYVYGPTTFTVPMKAIKEMLRVPLKFK